MLKPESLCAAVITFEPDAGLAGRVAMLQAQIPNLLLVDNSESDWGASAVRRAAQVLGLDLIENRSNLGVAVAINQALDWAAGQNLPWLLLVDQDTDIRDQNLLESYIRVIESASPETDVAAVGIATRAAQKGQGRFVETDAVVTSGSLLRVSAARAVGGAWEDLFVDGVDTEMCYRLRHAGFRILAFEHPAIQHRIGAARAVRLFGRTLYVTDHPPVRRYFAARNRLLIARRHSLPFGIFLFLREEVLAPMLESRRLAKLGAVVLGILHGMRGITGPAPRLFGQ